MQVTFNLNTGWEGVSAETKVSVTMPACHLAGPGFNTQFLILLPSSC